MGAGRGGLKWDGACDTFQAVLASVCRPCDGYGRAHHELLRRSELYASSAKGEF